MSKITKELARSVSDLKAGYTLGNADVAILNELARIALASLEAEPVAWRHFQETPTDGGYWILNDYKPNCSDVEPLYTAPPAPVSVPDDVSWEDVPEEITEDDMALASAWAHGFNQCCAAMLQGAENAESRCTIQTAPALDSSPKNAESRCSNSPLIPDGWVACSERMPKKQDGTVFLTWNGQYIGKELFLMGSFQCLKPEIITHWMPLPAAPQHEVK